MANFDVSSLTNYAKEIGFDLFSAAIGNAQTFKDGNVRIIKGAGSTFKIPVISHTLKLQTGGCNLSGTSTTSLSQATYNLVKLNVKESICDTDLKDKFLDEYLPLSQNSKDVIPFEEDFLATFTASLSKSIDIAYWNGDTDTGLQGIFNLLTGTSMSASVVTVSTSAATTSANIVDLVETAGVAIPADVASEEKILWCSYNNYGKYLIGSSKAYQTTYTKEDYQNGNGVPVWNIPNLVIKPTIGIQDDKRMLIVSKNNIGVGTGDERDMGNVNVIYDQVAHYNHIEANWKMGAGIAAPSQAVFIKVTA